MATSPAQLLEAATIEVQAEDGPHSGSGVLVAPGLALTSANLVGYLEHGDASQLPLPSRRPVLIHLQNQRAEVRIAAFLPDVDLALLELPFTDHLCVYLDGRARERVPGQLFTCFGFPPGERTGRTCYPALASHRSEAEARRLSLNLPSDIDLSLFTGAALLDERSGGVSALVVGARAVDQAHLVQLTELRHYLLNHFKREELASLSFDLGITLRDLPGYDGGLPLLILELIRTCDATGRLPSLIRDASAARPRNPFQPSGAMQFPPAARELHSGLELVATAYRQRLAGAIELAALLERPALARLVEGQRSFHAAHPAWMYTLSADQRRTAGPCYPPDVRAPRPCPYPGLRSFDEQTARYFYGREADVAGLLRQLGSPATRLLVITGASGTGKSSLVRAGLLPELRAMPDYQLAGGEALRLGEQPYSQLLHALGLAPDEAPDPAVALRALLARPQPHRLVLVVDQCEDLLLPIPTVGVQADRPDHLAASAEQERQRAVALLRALREADALPLTMVLVVRADTLPALAPAGLDASDPLTCTLRPLRGTALRAAIVSPAEERGVVIEPELVEKLLAQAEAAANPLPLVQVALAFLWNRMRGNRLTLQFYEDEIGSLGAAVQRQADATLNNLSPAQVPIARNLLIRLVELREQSDVRRPQRREQLLELGDTTAETTLSALLRDGLVVDDTARSVVWIELAHDALIADWPTLRDRWLGREEYGLGQGSLRRCEEERRRWEREVSNWHHSGKQQLLTDLRLIAQGAAWMHGCGVELGPVPGLAAFVAASQDERTLQIRRRHMLLIYLLAFFVISIFVIYLFFTPVLPAGRVYDNILRAVCL